jgi:hypothetical protein
MTPKGTKIRSNVQALRIYPVDASAIGFSNKLIA